MPAAGSHTRIDAVGPHHVDDRLDQRARREVLARARLDILGVLGEQALVGVALHVGVEDHPLLAVDQVRHQPLQLRRVLDLVLRLAEDDAERAGLLAEFDQDVAVVDVEARHRRAGPAKPSPALAGRSLAG